MSKKMKSNPTKKSGSTGFLDYLLNGKNEEEKFNRATKSSGTILGTKKQDPSIRQKTSGFNNFLLGIKDAGRDENVKGAAKSSALDINTENKNITEPQGTMWGKFYDDHMGDYKAAQTNTVGGTNISAPKAEEQPKDTSKSAYQQITENLGLDLTKGLPTAKDAKAGATDVAGARKKQSINDLIYGTGAANRTGSVLPSGRGATAAAQPAGMQPRTAAAGSVATGAPKSSQSALDRILQNLNGGELKEIQGKAFTAQKTQEFGKGNIDLNSRVKVQNPDGTFSTEQSFSVNIDGKEVLLPKVVNGKVVSEEEAINHYYETGENLGVFDTPEEADEYAEWLHNRQEEYYGNKTGMKRRTAPAGGEIEMPDKREPEAQGGRSVYQIKGEEFNQAMNRKKADDAYRNILRNNKQLFENADPSYMNKVERQVANEYWTEELQKARTEKEQQEREYNEENERIQQEWENNPFNRTKQIINSSMTSEEKAEQVWEIAAEDEENREELTSIARYLTMGDDGAAMSYLNEIFTEEEPDRLYTDSLDQRIQVCERMLASTEMDESLETILNRDLVYRTEKEAAQLMEQDWRIKGYDPTKSYKQADTYHYEVAGATDLAPDAGYTAGDIQDPYWRAYEEAGTRYIENSWSKKGTGIEDHPAQFMDDKQAETFIALMNAGKYDEAHAYYDAILPSLKSIRYNKDMAKWRAMAEAKETGLLAGLGRAGANLLGAIPGVYGTVTSMFGNEEAQDPHSWYYYLTNVSKNISSVRADVWGKNSQKLLGGILGDDAAYKFGVFWNGVANSMIDNTLAIGIGQAIGGTSEAVTTGIVQLVMSSEATSAAFVENREKGLDPTESSLLAIGSGAIEAVTEKYSIEALLKPDVRGMLGDWKQLATYMGKTMIAEGSEEAASDVLNLIMDSAFSVYYNHEDEIREAVNAYVAQQKAKAGTYTQKDVDQWEKEGLAQAWGDWWQQTGVDALAGAASAGGKSGGRVVANIGSNIFTGTNIKNNGKNEKTGSRFNFNGPTNQNSSTNENQQKKAGTVADENKNFIVKTGKSFNKDTYAYKLAEKIDSDMKKGKSISAYRWGKLALQIEFQGSEDISSSIKNAVTGVIKEGLKESGIKDEAAGELAELVHKAAMQGVGALNRSERATLIESKEASQIYMEMAQNTEDISGATSDAAWKTAQAAKTAGKEAAVKTAPERAMVNVVRSIAEGKDVGLGMRTAKVGKERLKAARETIEMAKDETINALGGEKAVKTAASSVVAYTGNGEKTDAQVGNVVGFEKGKVKVQLADGSEQLLDPASIETTNGNAQGIIGYMRSTPGMMSEKVAGIAMAALDAAGDKASDTFAEDAVQINAAARMGAAMPTNISMDKAAAQTIYEAAAEDAKKAAAERIKPASIKAEPGKGGASWDGVKYGTKEWTEKTKSLSAETRRQANVAAEFAKLTGHQINFVYDDSENGVQTNGSYDEDTGVVTINLAAQRLVWDPETESWAKDENGKLKSEGGVNMLATIPHELTHWLQANSREGYDQLKQFILNDINKTGADLEQLILDTIQNYNQFYKDNNIKDADGNIRTMTIDDAIYEIVANGSEALFTSEEFANRLKATNSSLYGKIKDYVQKLIGRLKTALTGVNSSLHYEARLVRDVEKMAEIWLDTHDETISKMAENIATKPEKVGNRTYTAEQINETTAILNEAKNNTVKDFSTAQPVQVRSDGMIAVHNLDARGLMSDISMGGFPMPSIALLAMNKAWEGYGDISIFFGQDALDFENGTVYNGDAYTPTLGRERFNNAEDALKYLRGMKARETANAYSTLNLFRDYKKLTGMAEARTKAYLYQKTGAYEMNKEYQRLKALESRIMENVTTETGIRDDNMQMRTYGIGMLTAAEEISKQKGLSQEEKAEILQRNIKEAFEKNGMTAKMPGDGSELYDQMLEFIDGAAKQASGGGMMESKPNRILSFKDVKAVSLPSNTPKEVVFALRDAGVAEENFYFYPASKPWARAESLKAIPKYQPGVSFSVQQHIQQEKFTSPADKGYAQALINGNEEEAQRMVDRAAKKAGYVPLKLYHGTRNFGFTEFDVSGSGGMIFTTNDRKIGETYSSDTSRSKISEKSTIDVGSLKGNELLKEAQKNLKKYQGYNLANDTEKAKGRKEASDSLSKIAAEITNIIKENESIMTDRIDRKNAYKISESIEQIAQAKTDEEYYKARDHYEAATWGFKWANEDLLIEMLGDGRSEAINDAMNKLSDYLYDGDIYIRGNDVNDRVFDNEMAMELDAELHKGVYELYGNPGKQLVVDAKKANWNQIIPPTELNLYGPQRTRDIAAAAKAMGYDSVLIKNVKDSGGETEYNMPSDVSIFFNAEQLKSADAVTYDNDGNVIPLSERFNRENADIRYSMQQHIQPQRFTAPLDKGYADALINGDMKHAQDYVDDVANDAGYTIHAFHGTGRADRVGTVFRPERATSGPMAYFTDSKEIAEGYARDKKDTSIAYEEEYGDYHTQFRYNLNGKDIPVSKLWDKMDWQSRMKLKEAAKHINFDDELENIIYDKDAQYGPGGFTENELRYHKGNVIDTLVYVWLDSANLWNREQDFLKVLELAGLNMDKVKWNNPDAREEKVYDTYLKIQNPFDTSEMYTEEFLEGLQKWWDEQEQDAYTKESMDTDFWDKNNITVDEWIEHAHDDIANNNTHNWTRIPDGVTAYLKEQGYDGIKDEGGKGGGMGHTVWIPFSSEQVKSAETVTYDDDGNVIPPTERFNPEKTDIRYSLQQKNRTNINTEGIPKASNVAAIDQMETLNNPSDENSISDVIKSVNTDEEYLAAVNRGDIEAATEMLMNKLKTTEGIVPIITPHWDAGRSREIARLIKTGNAEAIAEAAEDMACHVPKNAVLIPMPNHTGKVDESTDTMMLAKAISVLTGRPVVTALQGADRESRYAAKKRGDKGAGKKELGFYQTAKIPEGTMPIFVDNIVGSGITADAAREALGGGITLAFAKTLRSAGIKGLKNVVVTYDKNRNVIPLSQRLDKNIRNVNYSITSNPNMDVQVWMEGVKESGLATEAEKSLLRSYKDLRMAIDLDRERQRGYRKRIADLEVKGTGNLTQQEKRMLEGLKIRLKNSQTTQAEHEAKLEKVTGSEGYASMMREQQQLMNDYVQGKTQDEVIQAVAGMERTAEALKAEITKTAEELKALAGDERVRQIRARIDGKTLDEAATRIRKGYNSTINKQQLMNELARIRLMIHNNADENDIISSIEGLAGQILDRRKGSVRNESLESLRGVTIRLGDSALKEIYGTDSNLKEMRSMLAGSGIRIEQGNEGALDTKWEELLTWAPALDGYNGINTNTAENQARAVAEFVKNAVEDQQAAGREEFAGQMAAVVTDLTNEIAQIDDSIPTDPKAKQLIRALSNYVTEIAEQANVAGAKVAEMESRLNQLVAGGKKAANWSRAMKADVAQTIDYFNKTAKMAMDQAKRDRQDAIIQQLKDEHTQKIIKINEEWRNFIQRDAEARKQMDRNMMARRKMSTVINRINKLLASETDTKNIPENYKGLARELLSMFVDNDMGGGGRKLTNATRQTLQNTDRLLKIWEMQDGPFNLADLTSESGQDENGIAMIVMDDLSTIRDAMAEWNGRYNGKNKLDTLKQMGATLQRMQEAVSEIDSIIHSARTMDINGRKFQVEEMALRFMDGIRNSRFKGEKTSAAGKAAETLRKLAISGNITPEYFFKNLKNGGLDEIWNDFKRAENKNGLEIAKAKDRLSEIAEKHGYKSWDQKKKYSVEALNDTVEMNLEQLMALWATWKRELSIGPEMSQHLTNGGFYVAEDKKGKGLMGRQKENARPHVMDEETMAAVEDLLTEEQKAYVDDMVAYLSKDMSDLGNEASMRMYGIKKYKEDYYFPFRRWSGVGNFSSDKGMTASATENRAAHKGWTKRRINNAKNALEIGNFTQTAVGHVVEMINYNTMAPSIEAMNKMLNWQNTEWFPGRNEGDPNHYVKRNMRALFGQEYGQDALKYLETLMKDLNGGVAQDPRGSTLDKLLSTFKKNAVAGSLSVAAQQPLSYIRAAMEISQKYLIKGLNPATFKGSYQEMMKHSGVAVIKAMGRFDMGYGASAKEYVSPEAMQTTREKIGGKISDIATGLPEIMDRATWTRMWEAVKAEQHAQHPEMDVKSDEFLDMVGQRFNEVMRRTQVYDSVLVKSSNMRSKNFALKSLTSFMAEPTLSLNVLRDAALNIKEKGGAKKAAMAGATFLLSAIAQAAAKGFFGAGRNPDDKKTKEENFAYRMAYNLISEMNPMSLIPGYGDLVEALTKGELTNDAMTPIGKMYDIIQSIQKADKSSPYRVAEDTAGQLAQLFTGVPAKNIMRDARAMVNFFAPDSGLNALMGGKQYANRETSADVMKYQTIDTVMSQDLIGMVNKWLGEAGYQTSNAAYEQRIYQARKAGDTAKEKSLTNYLLKGKGVKEDTLASSIMTNIKKDESTSVREKMDMLQDAGMKESTLASWVGEQYQKGEISREEAVKLYKEANPDAKDKDIYAALEKREYKAETGNTSETLSSYFRIQKAIDADSQEDYNAAKQEMLAAGYTEKDINSNALSYIKKQYSDGKTSAEEAKRQMKKWRPDMSDNDIWWTIDRLDYQKETKKDSVSGNYYRLWDAMDANSADEIGKAVSDMVKHGMDKKNIKTQITKQYKDDYLKANSTEKRKIRDAIQKAYRKLGYTAADADKVINGWSK